MVKFGRPRSRRAMAIAGLAAALCIAAVVGAAVAGSAGASAQARSSHASAYPFTIENCGQKITIESPPQRAITMNEGATEIMLKLGLQKHMIGTAYLDDPKVYPPLAKVYAQVPVLSKEYPSSEVVLAKNPDFVYGSYVSAFDKTAAGTRPSLASHGIASYLSPNNCLSQSHAITPPRSGSMGTATIPFSLSGRYAHRGSCLPPPLSHGGLRPSGSLGKTERGKEAIAT